MNDHNANLKRFETAFRNVRHYSRHLKRRQELLARCEGSDVQPPFDPALIDDLKAKLAQAGDELDAASAKAIHSRTFVSAGELATYAATIL